MESQESCGTCGGDRRIANSFGSTTTCPSCHGSGRKAEDTGFRDVTKTKPSHHTQSNKAPTVVKQIWPLTFEGARLATEVKECGSVSAETKARMTREIIDHETSHGTCTQTFMKKVRRQIRPMSA
jgi:hypothetical protein